MVRMSGVVRISEVIGMSGVVRMSGVKRMSALIRTELWKLKRYSVIWIGIAATLSVVLLTRFMATAADGVVHTFANFSDSVIWNNITLIYPAAITLITGYMVERERTDDTMKNILPVPVSFRRLLVGKLLASGLLAVFLAVIEFLFTMGVCVISGYPGLTAGGAAKSLIQMTGMNLCVYIAVLPVIAFTGQRAGTFMAGVAFAFFYGFIGAFASGHGLTSIYPITAGLGLIRYQEAEVRTGHVLLSASIMVFMLVITGLLVLTAKNRESYANK